MLKFMKPQSKVISPERLQKQKELFGYAESCFHGFPTKPSAIAWDPKLQLLALATKNGNIRVYGKSGVEFYGTQDIDADAAISQLCFLPGQSQLICLCEDNSLHLWEIQEAGKAHSLIRKHSTSLEGKLKKISIIIEDAGCKNLLVGTEGGNIYILELKEFSMTNDIIYQDVVMQNVPEDYKVNPGPVEVIAPHPSDSNKLLIGYQRGLIVLWDRKQLCADQTYVCSQQLECLCWNTEATEFVSSHNDGSYMTWDITSSSSGKDGPNTVYGPFPCKPINKIVWKANKTNSMTIFGGGMPRANYGDRHTVTVMQGDDHVTFNLSSKVVDFIIIDDIESQEASSLVILTEEEIVFVDLVTEGWPIFQNCYLSPLHSSAVTYSYYVSKVDSDVFDKIKTSGENQISGFSKRTWPISGGKVNAEPLQQKDLLLTGHEDGTVRFWDASGVCLTLLYKLMTAPIFTSDDLAAEGTAAEDDEWPPFRKAGLFDPYSDDPRLAIKKLEMCPHTGQLVVAGTAGQIIMMEIGMDDKEISLQCVDVNLVGDNDSFIWKSHSKLDMQTSPVSFCKGMQPLIVIQFYPPASCTSLNLHSEWGLVAAGTAHGFALFDYISKKNLLAKSTLSPLDFANASDEGPMSRRKSLKKSLRESFRRLRRGRSQRKTKVKVPTAPQAHKSAPTEEEAVKPVERAIEARSQTADYIGSMVRCLHLTKCYMASSHLMSATLWAGTNSGAIYIFTIAIPPSEKRMETPITVQLGKEIHLKHAAPVVNIMILDGLSRPFPDPMAVKRGTSPSPDITGPHRVLITSEEQFKVFTLPQLKPYCKYKLTAQEGSRVRKVDVAEFFSTADKNYSEMCVMVVTNQGDISVYSLPEARKQVMAQCIKREDIGGINSVVFTKKGEALYLISAGEMSRISLSAANITSPEGTINDLPKKKTEVAVLMSEKVPQKTPLTSEKKLEEVKENGDTSVLSGDLTIDSIRDHMASDEAKAMENKMCEILSSSTLTTTKDIASSNSIREEITTTSVSVVKTSNITVVSSQGAKPVQVVETNQPEENHAVNGTEDPSSHEKKITIQKSKGDKEEEAKSSVS